jgi:hypothetical protein
MQYTVILVRFKILNYLDIFSKNHQVFNFMKIHEVGDELFLSDGQTDSHFSQCYESI